MLFGGKYKQRIVACDAGYAVAPGKSLIIQHAYDSVHLMKKVHGAARADTEPRIQITQLLDYVLDGRSVPL